MFLGQRSDFPTPVDYLSVLERALLIILQDVHQALLYDYCIDINM